MSLKKINIFITIFLALVVSATVLQVYGMVKEHFQSENVLRIKGDVLEVGYLATKFIEHGDADTLDLLYNAVGVHKEYQALSIAMGGKIIFSSDKKNIGTSYKRGVEIEGFNYDKLQNNNLYFKKFTFIEKGIQKEIDFIVDLNEDYLVSGEKDVQHFVNLFLVYFTLIMLAFLLLLYFLTIHPLIRLNNSIKDNDFTSSDFFIKEYADLYKSFGEKYNKIDLLNKTLEDKVVERTELLTKTNAQFKEAQQLTRIGNWEWNIIDNTITWSDEIYTIFGLKQQEFKATYDAFINSIHPDDRILVQDAVNRALESGKDYSIHHRILLPSGSEKVVYEKGRVEFNSDKKAVRMIGTVQDITERYKRTEELELQSNLLNSVTDSIFVHNLDGTLIYVNESAYITRGYTKEELLSMKVQELDYRDDKIGEEVYIENIKNIQKQVHDKGSAVFEVSHRRKDGSLIPLEVTTRIVHVGENSYMISIARDITKRKAIYRSLEVSEKQYRKLVENSQIGIYNTNLNGEILYANDSIVKIMGYGSKEELYKQQTINWYKNPAQRSYFLHQLLGNGKVDEMELDVLTKDLDEKTVLISAHIEGEVISGIVMDITESKKAMEEITKLSKVIEEIDDIIMISDRAGVLTFVNDAFIKHTGFSREESIGKTASILKSGKHDKNFYKNMWKEMLSGNVFRGLFINRKKDGELYHEEKTISPIKNDAGVITSFVSTGKDITQRVEMQQELEILASTDHLTGICNRHKFEELFKIELDRVSRYKNPLTLIMFDIDHFKKVNDTYGHDVGDMVLKSIVNVVNKNIRNTDIFARWGGEEFLVLCPETDSKNAGSLAEKLRSSIETNIFETVGNITCSFGVTSYKSKEKEESFVKRADDALYKAKNEGRNMVIVA